MNNMHGFNLKNTTTKNGVFWDVMPCGSCATRATWHKIPEDTILHGYRRENLKSYTILLLLSVSKQLHQGMKICYTLHGFI
jgi:hypothetical protein